MVSGLFYGASDMEMAQPENRVGYSWFAGDVEKVSLPERKSDGPVFPYVWKNGSAALEYNCQKE